jgi:hypothetical protein
MPDVAARGGATPQLKRSGIVISLAWQSYPDLCFFSSVFNPNKSLCLLLLSTIRDLPQIKVRCINVG